MSFRNVDWDKIEVGDYHLDHSENFFGRNRGQFGVPLTKDIDEMNRLMAATDLDNDKENEQSNMNQIDLNSQDKECDIKPTVSSLQNEQIPVNNSVEEIKPLKVARNNIAEQWSTQKSYPIKRVLQENANSTPNAYKFKDRYQRNKEEALRRQLEKETKMRKFQSRPIPNFNVAHMLLERKKVVAVTIPVTPKVLKKSREMEEKRRKNQEEEERQLAQLHKFKSKPPAVLKQERFVPKKISTLVQSKPFTLHSERRGQERRQYNIATKIANDEKLKQVETEEELRQQLEEDRVKELRKLTEFKARPNPFK